MIINNIFNIGVFLILVNFTNGSPVNTEAENDTNKENLIAVNNSNEITNIIATDFLIDILDDAENDVNGTNNKNLTLTQLEKQKSKLYQEIIKSIDDSVLLLENTNDTEAKLGINFMEELKNQLKKINGTDSTLPKKDDLKDARRLMSPEKKITLTYEEIASLFKKANKSVLFSNKEVKFRDLEIKKKIDDWILQRQLEKQKILDYKNQMRALLKLEKCPRYGEDKKKIKTKNGKRKRYRPCCRKCCKKSYMGCL